MSSESVNKVFRMNEARELLDALFQFGAREEFKQRRQSGRDFLFRQLPAGISPESVKESWFESFLTDWLIFDWAPKEDGSMIDIFLKSRMGELELWQVEVLTDWKFSYMSLFEVSDKKEKTLEDLLVKNNVTLESKPESLTLLSEGHLCTRVLDFDVGHAQSAAMFDMPERIVKDAIKALLESHQRIKKENPDLDMQKYLKLFGYRLGLFRLTYSKRKSL